MGYLVSWTYGPGYVEALLDILSMILLSDVVALILIAWTCWKSRRSRRYDSITETSVVEKHDEVNSKIVTVSSEEVTQPVVEIEEEIEKVEASTQTKDTETKDQETVTAEEKTSVHVQTVEVEDVGQDRETQTSDQDESSDDSSEDHVTQYHVSRESITFTSGWRREVKLTELIKARLILENRVRELERKEITEADIEKELEPFLIGRYPIAGIIISETGEKMPLNEAYTKNIITRGTAVSLLEAQAAVGSIIDPRNGEKMSVATAKEVGLIDKRMAGILVRAERAVTGFKPRSTNETLSLFQAMKRNLVVESHGIRLLEAQIATGGIIDPVAHIRLPVEVAFERGLFDEHLHRILEDPSDDTKGFLDPNTGENLTYLELLQRCVPDEDTGLLLLPLLSEEDRKEYAFKYANASYLASPTHSNRTFSTGSETPSLDEGRDTT